MSGTQPQQLTVKGCLDGVYITIPNQALEMTSTEGSYIYTLDGENGLEFFAEDQSMHTFTVSLADNPQVTVSFQATAQRIDVTGLTVTYPEVFYIEGWNGLGNQYVGITSHDTDPERRYEINIEPYNATVKDVVWVSHDRMWRSSRPRMATVSFPRRRARPVYRHQRGQPRSHPGHYHSLCV